jgi:hypothetical protein
MKRAGVCLVAVALVIGCEQGRKETQPSTAPAVVQSRPVEPALAQPVVTERSPARAAAPGVVNPVWIGDAYTLCQSDSTGLAGKTVQITGNVHWFKTTADGTLVDLDGDADGVWRVSCHFPSSVFAVGCLTVRGTLTHANKRGSVRMDRCELVY